MTHTPAQELRAAADKLRRLTSAEGLEPGPWIVHNRGGWPEAVYSGGSDVVLAETTDEIDAPKAHASYIAAMHPGVALALVKLLTDCAELHEPQVCEKHQGCAAVGCQWCADEDVPCADVRNALALARALLGSQP